MADPEVPLTSAQADAAAELPPYISPATNDDADMPAFWWER